MSSCVTLLACESTLGEVICSIMAASGSKNADCGTCVSQLHNFTDLGYVCNTLLCLERVCFLANT